MRQNGIFLVPVALSEGSVAALSYARALAKSYQARLSILHVVEETAIWRIGWRGRQSGTEDLSPELEANLETWLERAGLREPSDEILVTTGHVGPEIVRVARNLPADGVVLATQGNTGIQARFLGGTAYRVLGGVRCPVVSVKPPGFTTKIQRLLEEVQVFGKMADRSRNEPRFPPKILLHPTDFSDASHHATLLAARMASHTQADLTVLHVAKSKADEAEIREKLEQVQLQVQAMGSSNPRLALRYGDPASEILGEAAETLADLMILGSEGIGSLGALSLGSTAARVVRQSSCPVVTLRADTSLQEIHRAFRKVYASLSVAVLRTPDEEEEPIGADDLMRSPASELFLGYYTRKGFVHALEEYGILQAIRNKGYEDLRPSFDLTDPFEHIFRIHFGDMDDREHLLIEATMRPGTIEVPLDGEVKPFKVLVALWLCMQNPRGSFSARKPPMPDQEYPGLGLGREILELFVLIAKRLGKEALVNRPMHLHNARYYHHRFRFLDPKMEGRLAAILRDTADISLSDASWAVHLECLKNTLTGEPLRWVGKEQVFPMSEALKSYFDQPEYRREVWTTAREERYEVEWERFEKKVRDVSLSRH